KWSVLRELVAIDMVWLAGVAVFFSVIGLFYYLRVVVYAYFHEPVTERPVPRRPQMEVMIGSNAVAIVLMGVLFPGALMALCLRALGG
ncbi:MAG: NADH:ubiquinone oxidoreductase subunit N, partial [Gammaproteobacteria bacterium]|nr:NADH:ubiquinone oxidoreductase subunit N [Gammaproteobacteria bacterium]